MAEWRPVAGYEYEVSSAGEVRRAGKTEALRSVLDNRGYRYVNLCRDGKAKKHQVHRLVALAFIPNPDGKLCVDHINGDQLDNCVEKLRWATKQENNRNSRKRADNTSGFKGVYFHKASGKWRATIRVVKQVHIGLFTTAEEAHAAYCAKAAELFGEFARTE